MHLINNEIETFVYPLPGSSFPQFFKDVFEGFGAHSAVFV